MTVKRYEIIDDIKQIATKLGKAPTRAEYNGRGKNKKLGKFSERQIKFHFGSFSKALEACNLSTIRRVSVQSEPGFLLARSREENKELKSYIHRLESDSVNSKVLRELIGSCDTTKLGEDSGWMRDKRRHKGSLTGIPTLFISDVHFDEVVQKNQVNGANEYNHDIAVQRIKYTFRTAVDLTKKFLSSPRYDGIICAFGGDNLSGNIHEELKETNDQRINKSILDLTDLYIEGIGTLADEFGKVFCPCIVGNHGRHDRKPRFKFRVQDNYEWLIYQYLQRYFKNDSRVSFLIPDSADAFYTVYNRTYCITHGYQFSGGTGISGAMAPLFIGMARKQKKSVALGLPFDTMIYGHWHHYIHTESMIGNGSIKGYDEYADQHNFAFERPMQALFIDHPSYGTTFRMPIVCDGEDIAKKPKVKLSW